MFDLVTSFIVYTSIGGQYFILRTSVGILYFIILEIDHWIASVVMRRMVLRRGVGSYPVFGAYCKMFSRGVSLVSEDIHTFHSKELLGVQCHGRERMGVVHATRIVVYQELVLRVAARLHVVTYIDDVTV